jgi:competence protein ComEA
VNLNTATAEELDALPGIGPVYAQRIIAYREANGPFEDVGEVMEVQGIGPACYEGIKDRVTVR